ncbi:hypothetical protein XA68_17496 [Ophiocordyceps unilateralis]|uniref:AAA+ ATPase domain-containing protein n=1 Tax=Ophiocordyceps unilateralis TaxID=268505 RepID=A0A2A9PJI8_OPHUN|nr:hypothetical protein XA68_17496 [Ophiocordyceps unilateralis]
MDSFLVSAGQASPLLQLVIFFYRQLGANLGLDPSVVLTVLGLLWAVIRIGSRVYDVVDLLFDRYFTCAMYVSEHDHIYVQLMKWLSHQRAIRTSRFLMAQTVWKSAWEDEDELDANLSWTSGGDDDGERRYLNFSNQALRSKPRYVPALGLTSFWHAGTYFRLNRKKEALVDTMSFSPIKSVEEIRISCSGRSIEPIKRLLAEAKAFYYEDTYRKTTIYRPRPKGQRVEGSVWQQVARRPVRPMSTVVLDATEKHGVLADINEYLHPTTPRWYASRGIPLRRGYLFHGPPGTGKTSFSFALAGVFGIDIYVISLQDVNVSEEDLATLFTRLPRRCIVLLEDIDTAGLRRDASDPEADELADAKPVANGVREGKRQNDGKSKEKSGKEKAKSNGKDNGKVKDEPSTRGDGDGDSSDTSTASETEPSSQENSRKRRRARRKRRDNKDKGDYSVTEGISLSGLLNAIDGVASHEGRVLIMTTNKPELLDSALVRPGRVDVQVAFANASEAQAAELFRRMYEASSSSRLEEKLDVSGESELVAVANEFGRAMPAGELSPAEIQGFLLKRKTSPRRALEDASGWVEASLKRKAARLRVSTVQ